LLGSCQTLKLGKRVPNKATQSCFWSFEEGQPHIEVHDAEELTFILQHAYLLKIDLPRSKYLTYLLSSLHPIFSSHHTFS